MKHAKLFVMLLVLMALVLSACGTKATEAPAAEEVAPAVEEAAPAGEQFFVFLPKGLDNPYWDECRKGMEAKMAELGVKAEFLGPEKSDATKQVEIFESVIARKPAAIAVSPNDPSTVKDAIQKATEAGIPVITWDADAPDSARLLYIGTNNVAAGRTAGEELAKLLGGKGKVAIINGALTAANAQERVQGFKEALANYPDIEIVADEPTDDDPAKALSISEQLLQAHPDLAAFYGVTGVGVPGAAGAVKQANKCDSVKVVGFDVVPQGIEFMRQGCVSALVSQRPYGMTAQALEIMVGLAKGEKPESTNVDTGVEIVYPDTLEEFLKTSH
ncbi:MAG: sugar-binding protein [Anaerolineales bacterium]|jgi:ABC-type sugar transport system substrate-binding protein|nr:sugar-binding protein [Anaerolineales bacterium]